MRFRNVLLILVCLAATFGLYRLRQASVPPPEATVIAAFDQHRGTYEQLRTMLLADQKLTYVADWGIETTDSPGLSKMPPQGEFTIDRYRQYLTLLKSINATRAGRVRRDAQPTICIGVWAAGFAGDTRHVEICSLDEVPPNQTADLDSFHNSPKPREPVYRHIDGNWYIWADW